MECTEVLQRIKQEDAIGQLRRREGRMAELSGENGEVKLEWVEGIARLLASPYRLAMLENEGRDLWGRGVRKIIWAGMGGSIMAVRTLIEMDYCNDPNGLEILPLDSTDPAALNQILSRLSTSKKIELPPSNLAIRPEWLATILADVMMIGVSMGMTSEEPITHLEWFAGLLDLTELPTPEHMLVMTLPGSYLDDFANRHGIPTRSLQPDGGTGTGGRMSAPTTRVFLLPVSLYLASIGASSGTLQSILQEAWQQHQLELATTNPDQHPFVQLAAKMVASSSNGICRLLISLPEDWRGLLPWIEQLMEESLGKGGKGIIVFGDQKLNFQAPTYVDQDLLHLHVTTTLQHSTNEQKPHLTAINQQPVNDREYMLQLSNSTIGNPIARLSTLAASFLDWQLSMALYGYLQGIQFAGQDAVEKYKARARKLREIGDPLQEIAFWEAITTQGRIRLLEPPHLGLTGKTPTARLAQQIQKSRAGHHLSYIDITFNGVLPAPIHNLFRDIKHTINQKLGLPIKVRTAPADYHSTEQSEMDGPENLISLRILLLQHETIRVGTYDDTFLLAQGISTWQAMLEQGRLCFLLLIDGSEQQAITGLTNFLNELKTTLTI